MKIFWFTLLLFAAGLALSCGQDQTAAPEKRFLETKAQADQGDALAQLNLGVMYANGNGVVKDEAEAVKWYRKAADQGDAWAQVNLGRMYANGNGVVKDETEAYKWFLLSGAQGHENARKNYELLESTLTPTQRAEGQKLAREFKPRPQ